MVRFVAFLISLIAADAARAWAPIQPPTACQFYPYGVAGSLTGTNLFIDRTGVERHNYNPSEYHNNQLTKRIIVGNAYTDVNAVWISALDLELNADFLRFSAASPASPIAFTGSTAPLLVTLPGATTQVSANPRIMVLDTDGSVGGAGFTIDLLRLCRTTLTAWATSIVPGEHYSGLMQGVGDVIYLSIPGPASGKFLNLALWAPEGNNDYGGFRGTDINMHVRCNAFPTATAYLAGC